ncbi:MAG: hypothetical protein HC915_20145 [Anaerolineae bacterium]|nr:hypothetical protein [Anaerolineae bacterium]
MDFETLDLTLGWASLILTLCILSYLLSDNLLYRLALHILVGVTAGYVTVVAVETVVLPWIDLTILNDSGDTTPAFRALGMMPFLLAAFLLLKTSPRLARVGNLGLAFIIGVGTGVAVVGALAGTVIPLVRSTSAAPDRYDGFNAAVLVLGTVGTLVYFQYLAKRRVDGTLTRTLPMRLLAGLGQIMLAVAFGTLYAGALITSLTVFGGVIQAQLTFLLEWIG